MKTIFSVAGITVLFMGLFSLIDHSLAQEATKAGSVEYGEVPWIGSRNVIWIVAQVHLLFAGFVLGVPIFALLCEIIGVWTQEERYVRLAKEFTNLVLAAFEMTAMLGALLLLFLLALYPKLVNFLTTIFFPTYYIYVLLFGVSMITLYLYWSGFETMKNRKGLHLFMGFLLNLCALFVMIVPNSWATFQASPVVLAEGMGVWEKAWAAMQNPTWWPINIHRFISNIVLGGFICGAYAAIRYLGAQKEEERAHYDWMGYIGNFIGIFGLLTLPFAGYWLMREIYIYNQQMGITLMGGFLSWLFILQAVLIGVLFLGSNYYFWLGLAYRTEVAQRYTKPILGILTVLLICFGVWLTPHSLVASIQEARAMGGAHHPVLGVLGVMSAKMTAVNVMILISFISFLMYWRAGKQPTVAWAKVANTLIVSLFGVAILGVIVLGVWGYFVPAIVRINKFSVWQVLLVLFVLVTVTPLVSAMLRGAKLTSTMTWGRMPVRSQHVLILNAVTVVLTMALMGYARSASRVHWHIYGVLEDTSPHAYSPALGHAGSFASLSTFVFILLVVFLFWTITRTSRRLGFSTQYFFLAPFVHWVVSLADKPVAPASQVSSGQPRYFGKAMATACGLLVVFAYLSYQVPQMVSLPPQKVEFDPSQITTRAELVKVGQGIFFGKGQCALCHTLEPTEAPRAPVLRGVGAKLTREFIYESLTQPQAFIYMDHSSSSPRPFPAKMPVITKPPVGLSEPELLAVMAFVQSLGGEVTIQPEEVNTFMPTTDSTGAS
jgi:cytochrome bd ubiquinol oxidase subunit I